MSRDFLTEPEARKVRNGTTGDRPEAAGAREGIAHLNRGKALKAEGRAEEAVEAFEKALALDPRLADAHFYLGLTLQTQNQPKQAVAHYEAALALEPGHALALLNLGNALNQQGKAGRAIAAYEKALALDPASATAHNNLGFVLQQEGRLEEAIENYEKALALNPDYPLAQNNLNSALKFLGEPGKAIAHWQKAVSNRPDSALAHLNLGVALKDRGKLDIAAKHFERAVKLKADYAAAHLNLGAARQEQGKVEEAIACFHKALAIDPRYAPAYNSLAGALKLLGKLDEALTHWEKAVAISPGYATAHSNRLLCLNYDSRLSAEEITAEHKAWNRKTARHLAPAGDHANDPDPERRLKVGYVSADFRSHPVASFIEPVIAAHDHGAFEVFCYANVAKEDKTSERFRHLADHWRSVVGQGDEALARMIRDDHIDILIDLSGHTGGTRIMVFARKPAPVQASYIGYANTTGLSTMDYRLSDAWADPPGQTEHLHSEELIRLPRGFLSYLAPPHAPPVAPVAASDPRHFTFGSFNNLSKMGPEVIAAWSRILGALPKARLVLKNPSFAHAPPRARYEGLFAGQGISSERLHLMGRLGPKAHLDLYNRIGVALDTFPYNGTTTTCEALWMGVPAVVLAGDRHAGRVGVSLLSSIGLTELIAESPDHYVEIAVKLGRNADRLKDLKTKLRERMSRSPLLDAKAFTRSLEEAYRAMWRRWCAERRGAPVSTARGIEKKGRKARKDERPEPFKLHIGGREPKRGWKIFNIQPGPNVDFVGDCVDLSRFQDDSIDEVYASHVLEHLGYQEELPGALGEIYRVLKPGGLVRISVPDFETICRLFLRPDLDGKERFHLMRVAFGGQIDAHDFHKVGLTWDSLSGFLKRSGFTRIRQVESFGLFDDVSRLRLHSTLISLNLEARKAPNRKDRKA